MQRTNLHNFAADPGRVCGLAREIAGKRLSPVALVQRYLDRIAAADPNVECWRQVDAERALATAQEREREAAKGAIRGALHGVPVAIKDIIDVEGLPTRANSRSRCAAAPANSDAEIVLALKTAGAIVLGKVHTTEFAFFDPSPARNPHDVRHTPGGSSSGSAAAVAAGMAPVAVGTQTVASVNRPAAYCGISAFKPSTRSLSTYGITPLAPSYDTPGFYGWSVADAVYVFEAVAPPFVTMRQRLPAPARLSVCIPDDPHIADAIPEMKAALTRFADALANAGHGVERPASPISFERLFNLQRSTMAYEAGRALRHLLQEPEGAVGEKITTLIRDGLAIAPSRYFEERSEIDQLRSTLFAELKADVFLWPATPASAPEGLSWTGDPKYISPWTALAGPIVSVPAGFATSGLPIGCILSARPGTDVAMCTWARQLVEAIGER
jgi:aspartyl-tRNA(Asn)/glutamyl-tRNA(Gln) amidotransferase subunit A